MRRGQGRRREHRQGHECRHCSSAHDAESLDPSVTPRCEDQHERESSQAVEPEGTLEGDKTGGRIERDCREQYRPPTPGANVPEGERGNAEDERDRVTEESALQLAAATGRQGYPRLNADIAAEAKMAEPLQHPPGPEQQRHHAQRCEEPAPRERMREQRQSDQTRSDAEQDAPLMAGDAAA